MKHFKTESKNLFAKNANQSDFGSNASQNTKPYI